MWGKIYYQKNYPCKVCDKFNVCKIAMNVEPIMQFWCPSRFRNFFIFLTKYILWWKIKISTIWGEVIINLNQPPKHTDIATLWLIRSKGRISDFFCWIMFYTWISNCTKQIELNLFSLWILTGNYIVFLSLPRARILHIISGQ